MLKKTLWILICLTLTCTGAYAAEYYVDAALGDDANAGTQAAPFATIGQAASVVKAGDTVTVMPGIYYGPVNITAKGTADKPIIFRAQKSGENETVITNANRDVREGNVSWQLHDEEKNIWVIDYTVQKNAHIDAADPDWLFPARLLCDNADIIGYETYDGLSSLIYWKEGSQYMPGYPQGYFYDNTEKKLYLRLRTDGKYGSPDPNDHTIKVAPSLYTYISVSGEWGGSGYRGDAMGRDSYNICVGEYDGALATDESAAEPYYVTIDGFTLETPGYAGVFCRASDVTVRNCYFRGCRTGIRGAARLRSVDKIYSENILIEHCDWSEFPVYDDAVDLISQYDGSELIFGDYTGTGGDAEETDVYELSKYFWWQRKGKFKNLNYEAGSFTNHMGENWVIRYNYIHDCFDGLSYRSMQRYQNDEGMLKDVGCRYIEIYGNVFEKCLDNAIEVESRGTDISIHDNYFHNIPDAISWQPQNGTPWPTNIKIYRNVIHNTRDFNDFWRDEAGLAVFAFKFMAQDVNWNYGWPWMEDYEMNADKPTLPAKISLEDEGVQIFNNTIVSPGGQLISNVGNGYAFVPHYGFSFKNNAVVCDVRSSKNLVGGSKTATVLSNMIGGEYAANFFAPDSRDVYYITDEWLSGGGKYIFTAEDMGFERITRIGLNPTLKSGSPLIGAGTLSRYESAMSRTVGALNYGESFDMSNAGVIVR